MARIRQAPKLVDTLAETSWVFVECRSPRCFRRWRVDLEPQIERLGPEATTDTLRHALLCGRCQSSYHLSINARPDPSAPMLFIGCVVIDGRLPVSPVYARHCEGGPCPRCGRPMTVREGPPRTSWWRRRSAGGWRCTGYPDCLWSV